MFVRQHYNDHPDIFPLLNELETVKQHRLAGDPAKLLELISTRAAPRSARDDYYANVSRH